MATPIQKFLSELRQTLALHQKECSGEFKMKCNVIQDAHLLIDRAEPELTANLPENRPENEAVWTTSGGHRLRIGDMSDGHILNTINFLLRRGKAEMQVVISEMVIAPPLNGEYAQEAFDREFDSLLRMNLHEFVSSRRPVFRHLMAEAKKRGLRGQIDVDSLL